MAKPNFSFQKRQKELARQKKKEEKKQRKLEKVTSVPDEGQPADDAGRQTEQEPAGKDPDRS